MLLCLCIVFFFVYNIILYCYGFFWFFIVLFGEIIRIFNYLMFIGIYVFDVGVLFFFFWFFEEREKVSVFVIFKLRFIFVFYKNKLYKLFFFFFSCYIGYGKYGKCKILIVMWFEYGNVRKD